MNNLVKIGASSLGIMGLGGSLFSGMYFSSNDTVENVLKGFVFKGDSNTEDWGILQKKLEDYWNEETEENKNLLQEAKDKEKGIKAWCENKYNFKFNTLISSSESTKIKNLTKKYCTLNIKDKIGKEHLFNDNLKQQDQEFENQRSQLLRLANNLQIGAQTMEGFENIDYEEGDENKWKNVMKLCLEKYNTPYRGTEDEKIWDETFKNCKKDPNSLAEEERK